ncbi:MAG: acetate--CoA ligase family protein [Xanthobacteraceae bacterium]|nr:acetate--CoA ligase family protein [Xanthobacteraceae bacterium]
MFRSVEQLLRPRSIAIIGASETGGGGWAKQLFDNLAFAGFPAEVYLINPRRSELWGQKVYPDFGAIGAPIDLGVAVVPAEATPDVLTDGVKHGLKAALVYGARFGEGGDPDGARRAAVLRTLSEDAGLRISGPNCMGAVNVRDRLLLYPAPRVRALRPGSVGVVFQSGGTFQFWLQQLSVRGLGFSFAVSSGNELDLDLADYINFLVEDEGTRLICCMVEGIRRPDAFVAVAEKALARAKPILVVKIGASEAGQAAAKTHTGALAGDDRVFDAVCRKYGIVRCHSLDDMIETALAFAQGRLPRGNRIGMAIPSGGAKGLFMDYVAEEGGVFGTLTPQTVAALRPIIDPGVPAENPLDVGAGLAVAFEKYAQACGVMAADPNIDVFAMHVLVPTEAEDRVPTEPFAHVAQAVDKPVIGFTRLQQNVTAASRAFQDATGLYFLQSMPATVRAIRALIGYAATLRRGAPPASSADPADVSAAGLSDLLTRYHLPSPKSAFATTPDEATKHATEIGFPVAVKIVSAQASHKTEVGGVALNLASAEAVGAAATTMAEELARHVPGAKLDGFLVQEMVAGLELIVGVREDPQYGPLMLVGTGGVLVEALGDIAMRLLPVDEAEARSMLMELKARALFGAFRGRAPRDVDAAARAIAGLSRLFLAHRTALAELEVNPLIVLGEGEGVRAVDVRVVRRGET